MIRSNHFLTVAMMVVSLLLAGQTHAVPAHPAAVKVRQPDGTTLTIRLHGNEHQHYNTTADGVAKVVPALIEKGYTIVTVSELYRIYGKELQPHHVYMAPWYDE